MKSCEDLGHVKCWTNPDNPLPLFVEPTGDPALPPLLEWLRNHEDWVQAKIVEHGAILLKGFDVRDAHHFEDVCRAIAPGITADYVGTPGTRLTDIVTPASEGPTEYPIPPHCELMYLPQPPTRIFFGCLTPPTPGSGETPMVDNRRIWQELPSDVRDRFSRAESVRIVRTLSGPKSRFGLFTLVRWDDFFVTKSRDEVEAQCESQGFEWEWKGDDKLQLVIHQPVTRKHPVSGEVAWCNQLLSYNVTSTADEFRRLYQLRPSPEMWRRWQFVRTTAQFKKRFPVGTVPAVCTMENGDPFPEADIQAVRDTIWKLLVYPTWEAGSVVAIDNFVTSHGRFPSWGTRKVVACLA